MIFLKRSKLVVDAFIGEKYISAYEAVPLDYSVNYYPTWWKNIKKTTSDKDAKTNVKGCAGIINFYRNSITLPMWSDLDLSLSTNSWQYSDRKSELDFHDPIQRDGFKNEYIHIKLISPWLLKSEKNVGFMYMGDYYNQDNCPIEVPPGINEYYYQHSTNFNFFVHKDAERMVIPVGLPLANIIPMTEKEVVLNRHLVSDIEILNIRAKHSSLSFRNKYYTFRRLKENQESKKCPFGFSK